MPHVAALVSGMERLFTVHLDWVDERTIGSVADQAGRVIARQQAGSVRPVAGSDGRTRSVVLLVRSRRSRHEIGWLLRSIATAKVAAAPKWLWDASTVNVVRHLNVAAA